MQENETKRKEKSKKTKTVATNRKKATTTKIIQTIRIDFALQTE